MEQYGGEYLACGDQVSLKESALWSSTRMVLIRFPSSQEAENFYQSAKRTVFILEGL